MLSKKPSRPLVFFLSIGLSILVSAQSVSDWVDPSPHAINRVNVAEGVDLEVLDWGGSGRPVILLAGLGNTAHVFDEFAVELAKDYGVYAITRRGFGDSSRPDTGYDANQMGDDVVAVMDAMRIDRPVLAGHSYGGSELSSVATRFPDRVAGLVYLDAAYAYAFDPNGMIEQMNEMRERLEASGADADLRVAEVAPPRPPPPSESDMESVTSYMDYNRRMNGFTMPEAEVRRSLDVRPDGTVVGIRDLVEVDEITEKIALGYRSFKEISVPALALYSDPDAKAPWQQVAESSDGEQSGPQMRVVFENGEFERGVPGARVVRIPGSHHYIFLSHEEEVLREMRSFIAELP